MGRTHALELARRGVRVVVSDINAPESVADEIRAEGGEALVNTHSVVTEEGGKAIIDLAVDTWGRLDAVVTNATIYLTKPFHER
jgi:NAD(P)-dependent dehydrogenase (short-subunit alcohol dehydrogenase family)